MNGYEGPAGVHLSPSDALEVWKLLALHPTADNGDLRRRLKNYLEHNDSTGGISAPTGDSCNVGNS